MVGEKEDSSEGGRTKKKKSSPDFFELLDPAMPELPQHCLYIGGTVSPLCLRHFELGFCCLQPRVLKLSTCSCPSAPASYSHLPTYICSLLPPKGQVHDITQEHPLVSNI